MADAIVSVAGIIAGVIVVGMFLGAIEIRIDWTRKPK